MDMPPTKKRLSILFTASLLLIILFGCEEGQVTNAHDHETDSSERLNIYTTIFALENFIEKIGGDGRLC